MPPAFVNKIYHILPYLYYKKIFLSSVFCKFCKISNIIFNKEKMNKLIDYILEATDKGEKLDKDKIVIRALEISDETDKKDEKDTEEIDW